MRYLITLVCWALWRERNSRVFEGIERHSSRLVAEIKDEAWLWARAGARKLPLLVGSDRSE
jgi:hypothetical protein